MFFSGNWRDKIDVGVLLSAFTAATFVASVVSANAYFGVFSLELPKLLSVADYLAFAIPLMFQVVLILGVAVLLFLVLGRIVAFFINLGAVEKSDAKTPKAIIAGLKKIIVQNGSNLLPSEDEIDLEFRLETQNSARLAPIGVGIVLISIFFVCILWVCSMSAASDFIVVVAALIPCAFLILFASYLIHFGGLSPTVVLKIFDKNGRKLVQRFSDNQTPLSFLNYLEAFYSQHIEVDVIKSARDELMKKYRRRYVVIKRDIYAICILLIVFTAHVHGILLAGKTMDRSTQFLKSIDASASQWGELPDEAGRAAPIPQERLIRMIDSGALVFSPDGRAAVFIDDFGYIRASFALNASPTESHAACIGNYIAVPVSDSFGIAGRALAGLAETARPFLPRCSHKFL